MLFLVLFFLLVILYISFCTKSGNFNKRYNMNRSFFDSFECGFSGSGCSVNSTAFSFMTICVFFVVFDLEIALLLNVCYQENMFFNYWCYLFFILVIVLGYICEVEEGYIRWSK